MIRQILASALACGLMVPVVKAQQVPYEKYTLPNGMTVILSARARPSTVR